MGKIDRVKQSTKRYGKRKRIFYREKVIDDVNTVNNKDNGETNVNNPVQTQPSTPTRVTPTGTAAAAETVSQKKFKNIKSPSQRSKEDPVTGYRLINLEILNTVIAALICPECQEQKLMLKDYVDKKKGLASLLYIHCSRCEYKNEFYTSSQQTDKSFDVNKRIVYAMRACGQGYTGIKTLTTLMDMPKPMTANNYDKLAKRYTSVSKEIADETMSDAAEEIRSKVITDKDQKDKIVDTSISHDGTWQRRGYWCI